MHGQVLADILRRRRMMRLLRWAFLGLALMAVLIGVITELAPSERLASAEPKFIPSNSASEISGISVKGALNDGRLFELIAEKASQWKTNENTIDFGDLALQLPTDTDELVNLAAGLGTYYGDKGLVQLSSPVDLKLEAGQSFYADDISVDVKNWVLYAKGDVLIHYEPFMVKAGRMIISDKGKTIRLMDGVSVQVKAWRNL